MEKPGASPQVTDLLGRGALKVRNIALIGIQALAYPLAMMLFRAFSALV